MSTLNVSVRVYHKNHILRKGYPAFFAHFAVYSSFFVVVRSGGCELLRLLLLVVVVLVGIV
jgi:hypothetical protein